MNASVTTAAASSRVAPAANNVTRQVQVLVAKPAVQPLLEATSDKDAKVRAAAADAVYIVDERFRRAAN